MAQPSSPALSLVTWFGSFRKGMLKERAMDLVTQTTILPLLFGCLGIFSLFRLLQRTRSKAYLRNAVVVVTGATSGLGKGKSRDL